LVLYGAQLLLLIYFNVRNIVMLLPVFVIDIIIITLRLLTSHKILTKLQAEKKLHKGDQGDGSPS